MTDDYTASALYYDTDTQSYCSMSALTEGSNHQSEMDIQSEAGVKEDEKIASEEEFIQVVLNQRSRWMGWVS